MAQLTLGRQLSAESEAHDSGVLGGNSSEVVNAFGWTALGVFCGLGAFALGAQLLRARRPASAPPSKGGSGSHAWVLVGFAFCYSLLIPGLFSVLFSYDLSGMGGTVPLRWNTETMASFVGELWENQAYLGAVLVVLYAMVIPAVKLVMLVLSELWRRGTNAEVLRARKCVYLLQSISKWASPDMYAYLLLLYLLRALDHPPTMVAVMELDVGFTCFSIFCVGSTMAALCLEMPPLPEGETEDGPRCCAGMRRPPVLAGSVALLFAAFVPLLVAGLSMPSMSLRVNPEGFFEPNGPLDPVLKPIVMSMGIEELAHAEVSISQCLGKLEEWALAGEANGLIGFLLLAVFAVAATVVDMVLLLASALTMWRRAARPAEASGEAEAAVRTAVEPLRLAGISRVLKRLSFLDVAIVGIVVVVLGGQAYRVQGLILSMEAGLAPLFAAELCHYLAYHLVAHAQSGADATREVKLRGAQESAKEEAGEGTPAAAVAEV